jgi:hypothetical protein
MTGHVASHRPGTGPAAGHTGAVEPDDDGRPVGLAPVVAFDAEAPRRVEHDGPGQAGRQDRYEVAAPLST